MHIEDQSNDTRRPSVYQQRNNQILLFWPNLQKEPDQRTEAFSTYSIDNDNICILTLEEWNKQSLNIETSNIHYIIYSQELNKYSELLAAKQRFLLDKRIIKDTLSIVIIQNN